MERILLTREENEIFRKGLQVHLAIQFRNKSIFLLTDEESDALTNAMRLLDEKIPEDVIPDDSFLWFEERIEIVN